MGNKGGDQRMVVAHEAVIVGPCLRERVVVSFKADVVAHTAAVTHGAVRAWESESGGQGHSFQKKQSSLQVLVCSERHRVDH